MEMFMLLVLFSAALAGLVWVGLKQWKANAEQPKLQPIRIHKDDRIRRRR